MGLPAMSLSTLSLFGLLSRTTSLITSSFDILGAVELPSSDQTSSWTMPVLGTLALLILFGVVARAIDRPPKEFVKLQAEYVAAKESLLVSSSLPFEKLPRFPLRTPYWPETEERYGESIQFEKPGGSLGEIVNDELDDIRGKMPDLLYMRGDLHQAAKSNQSVKALLVIEEVKQSRDELAIVAVVFSKHGTIVNVDIRRSAWPNTIHQYIPRRHIPAIVSKTSTTNTKSSSTISGLSRGRSEKQTTYAKDLSSNLERFYLYFAPIKYEYRNQEVVPGFNQETIYAADSIAKSVYGIMKKKHE